MGYETILVERKEQIGVIKLNRPERRNALGSQLLKDLIGALHELDEDPEVHIIVLTSNVPGVFCAGRDLAEGSSDTATDIMNQREVSSKPAELWLTFRSLKKVVISAVSGYALAGGTGLAACCDIAIAAEDAVFGLPEINVGLWPMTIAPALMRMVPTIKKCFEIFLTGDRLSAQEAERLGLVNMVVPSDKLEETVMEFARKLASKSQKTLQVGKKSFYTMLDMEYTKAMEYAVEMISALAISEDGIEGQKAFVEKRKPKWAKLA